MQLATYAQARLLQLEHNLIDHIRTITATAREATDQLGTELDGDIVAEIVFKTKDSGGEMITHKTIKLGESPAKGLGYEDARAVLDFIESRFYDRFVVVRDDFQAL